MFSEISPAFVRDKKDSALEGNTAFKTDSLMKEAKEQN